MWLQVLTTDGIRGFEMLSASCTLTGSLVDQFESNVFEHGGCLNSGSIGPD